MQLRYYSGLGADEQASNSPPKPEKPSVNWVWLVGGAAVLYLLAGGRN